MASETGTRPQGGGPLSGLRVLEIAGLGPAPFCGMMLADHGAEVIRIDRLRPETGIGGDPQRDVLNRSRRNLNVDLKHPAGVALVKRLAGQSDVLLEGFRPGTMERLGLGPDVLLPMNPRLVYGRMTGWGQTGPLAPRAGHDINYIALSGALHAIGDQGGRPIPPLNLVGDFGGGAMMLAFGVLAAVVHARASGEGQVIDCAMTDGSALLMAMMFSFRAQGTWSDERGINTLDTGAHYYNTYETADGGFMAVGPVEPQFYRLMLDALGLAGDPRFADQNDRRLWPQQKAALAEVFLTRSRAEWTERLSSIDACVTPVLSMGEAIEHPHNLARDVFLNVDGVTQPGPAPKYSRTPASTPAPMATGALATDALLADLGFDPSEAGRLRDLGALA